MHIYNIQLYILCAIGGVYVLQKNPYIMYMEYLLTLIIHHYIIFGRNFTTIKKSFLMNISLYNDMSDLLRNSWMKLPEEESPEI